MSPIVLFKTTKSAWRSGFTIIELLVVLSIVAITSAVVIPGMSSFVVDSRVSSNVNEFIAAMTLARTEAVRRGALVTICRSSNADSAQASCDGGGNDWASGWLVYQENSSSNGIGTFDSGEVVVQRRGTLASGVQAQASPAISGVTFNSMGEPIGGAQGTMSFDFSVNNKAPRKVCINRNGRVKVIQKATANSSC